MKKRICILYTGGTIGMVPSEKGYVPSSGAFLDLLRAIPDLYWADMPEWDVVEFDPLLDSSDITVREWNQIGAAIAARYDDYDGFVVLHGTDTMAYSASAISFMLENLSKPVIFTGSQIPLGQIRSDGRDNIISSLLMAFFCAATGARSARPTSLKLLSRRTMRRWPMPAFRSNTKNGSFARRARKRSDFSRLRSFPLV